MGISEERSENSAYIGRESDTRLEWRRDMRAYTVGCEIEEQGLYILGLAVKRR